MNQLIKYWGGVSLLAALILMGACSPKEEAPLTATSAGKPTDPQEALRLDTPVKPDLPAAPNASLTAVAPPNAAAPDFASAPRPNNGQGNPMSDLEYLNHLVFQLNESRTVPPETKQMQFKTEAEQSAYEAAQQQRQAPVKDLNELVTAKVLKALPVAPNGQHYAIDPASGKVVLR